MRAFLIRLSLFASTAFLNLSPLLATKPGGHEPPASVAAWVQAVNAQVANAVTAPDGVFGRAVVSFRRGDDGRPADVVVVDASPALARAALATLRRLDRLPPMPTGIDRRQMIRMQLLFDEGSDPTSFQAQRGAMLAAADIANARIAARASATRVAVTAAQ
jgi:TonB family protein